MKFRITSQFNGLDFGNYDGETPADALEALARDAGYASYDDACKVSESAHWIFHLETEAD